MTPVSHGKPCAGNPHARFDEGASAPANPRRNALLHLAFYYHYGIEVEKNEALALNLFKSSAKQGCDEAEKCLKTFRLLISPCGAS